MLPSEPIREYTDTVCNQVRWKKARTAISEELENHIDDQRDAYIRDGAGEADATVRAIAQMGDPVAVGTQLDRLHRPKPQWGLLILTAAMVICGIVLNRLLFPDGSPRILSLGASEWIAVLAGAALLAGAYFADFTVIGKYPKTVYLLVMLLSFAAFLTAVRMNGKLYYASYCPLLFPLAFASFVYAERGKGYWGIVRCELAFLPLAAVTVLVPTVTGLLLLVVSCLVILGAAVAKGWFGVKKAAGFMLAYIPFMVMAALLLFDLLHSPYARYRIQAVFHPELDPSGFGYIGVAVKSLLENSRLVGSGAIPERFAALSSSNFYLIPAAKTDFLLTYAIFKMGWIVFGALTALLAAFITGGFVLCFRQKSGLGFFVSVSVLLTFTYQTVNYVLNNLGFELTGPYSLPLISHGNIALMINLALIGLMLSVFRSGGSVKDRLAPSAADKKGIVTWRDKKLTIDFSKMI